MDIKNAVAIPCGTLIPQGVSAALVAVLTPGG
jgi:hypothetical protein